MSKIELNEDFRKALDFILISRHFYNYVPGKVRDDKV
ncbi:MAG: hypothetical protein XD68_0878 [Synergistales bacterium 54_24]|nr:MAG: hypothetical protein XD68_0878 [Synergistales bacterium 54_24]